MNTAVEKPNTTLTFSDDQDLQHASCDGGNGLPQAGSPEAVFQLELGPGQSVSVSEDGALDALIMLVAACDDTAVCLAADDATEDILYTSTASATEILHVIVSTTVASATPTDYSISFTFP